MRPPRPTARTSLTALILSLLLTACSAGPTNVTITTPSSAPTSEAAVVSEETSTPEASPTPDTPAATIPDGYQVLTAPGSGISFAVPDTWVSLTADAFTPEATQLVANSTGMTAEQVTQFLETQIDVYATAAAPDANGVTESISVTIPTLRSLPTQAAFETMLSQIGSGLTAGEYSTSTTALGEAASMTYAQDIDGRTIHAAMVVVESPNGTYPAIMLVSGSAERTTELTEAVLSTLAPQS